MSPLASYKRLFDLAGAGYVLVAFLGRLPLAMSQLGALLLVSTATGSYGLGGLAAGALAVANALGAPVAGALADRVGQRPVVLVQSLLGATGLVALVAQVGGSTATTVLIAALAGLAMPQVGPLARVRWRPLTHGREDQPRLVDAAFAYEGAADEASFALGPALVGLLAVAIDPGGALLAAAGLLAVFGTAFALDHSARTPTPSPTPTSAVPSGCFRPRWSCWRWPSCASGCSSGRPRPGRRSWPPRRATRARPASSTPRWASGAPWPGWRRRTCRRGSGTSAAPSAPDFMPPCWPPRSDALRMPSCWPPRMSLLRTPSFLPS